MKQWLSDRIHVALPADAAFRLFTPRGEREWAPGWDPTFPMPTSDDSEPGTVFETDTHGRRGTWLVTDRMWGKRISYAQVVPGETAGRITVTLDAAQDGTQVEVVYELTSLSDAGAHHLKQFADGYGDYLQSWEDAIAASLRKRVTGR
jgi:hypothetical protein